MRKCLTRTSRLLLREVYRGYFATCIHLPCPQHPFYCAVRQCWPHFAPCALQARSTPGLLTTLVGHKTPANVDANLALTQQHPLGESDLRAAMATVLRGYRE